MDWACAHLQHVSVILDLLYEVKYQGLIWKTNMSAQTLVPTTKTNVRFS
jgi:hypothetical protein